MKDKLSAAIKVKLLEGKRYSFCSCGLSKNLPYCDNAHREYNEKGNRLQILKIIPKKIRKFLVYSATWKR